MKHQSAVMLSRTKLPWSWLFLAGVAALYILTLILDPVTAGKAWVSFGAILSKILPILIIVIILLFVFNLFAEPKWIEKYVGEKSGLRGWLVAIGAGILSVGPIYPWYVLLGELAQKGMRRSLVATFLYSRAIKLPLVPMMVHYFGAVFTVTILAHILVFAALNGILIKFLLCETCSEISEQD